MYTWSDTLLSYQIFQLRKIHHRTELLDWAHKNRTFLSWTFNASCEAVKITSWLIQLFVAFWPFACLQPIACSTALDCGVQLKYMLLWCRILLLGSRPKGLRDVYPMDSWQDFFSTKVALCLLLALKGTLHMFECSKPYVSWEIPLSKNCEGDV